MSDKHFQLKRAEASRIDPPTERYTCALCGTQTDNGGTPAADGLACPDCEPLPPCVECDALAPFTIHWTDHRAEHVCASCLENYQIDGDRLQGVVITKAEV